MKKIVVIFTVIAVLFLNLPFAAAESPPSPFVSVENGTFVAEGAPYQALGACLYPAHEANYDYIARTIREAKANGITLIRAVDIWEGVYGQPDSALYAESVWKRIDYIIKICGDYDMKVLLDISTMRQFLYHSPARRDSYDPAVFPLWEEVIEFICSRQNSFTAVTYKEDPVIMSYAIAGEPVCYGGELDDWSNGYFTSRSPEIIQQSVFHAADLLRENDTNHLISAGGLLHVTPEDSAGQPFYKGMWSYGNIDYAALHIYPAEGEGEWANLAQYSQYCQSIGKPLMMEEFGDGGTDMLYKQQYISSCYDKCYQNNIPVVILWNWSLGQGFDTFSHQSDMMDILHQNARRWGFQGAFLPQAKPVVSGQAVFSFEDGLPLFSPNTGDPGYGGNITVSGGYSTDGEYSLAIPVQFTEQYKWYWLYSGFSPSISLTGDYLAADVYLPQAAPPLYVKLAVNGVEQSESGRINNYLIPGQWNTVYLSLKNTGSSPEGCDFSGGQVPALQNVSSINLLFLNMNGTYTGSVYVDNIRTGDLSLFGDAGQLEIAEVSVAGAQISVSAAGGTGEYLYSYYLLKEGKICFSDVYTKQDSAELERVKSGEYMLRVYVQDAEKTRSVFAKNILLNL